MTTKIRYFVDTNLFIQFQDLDKVEWSLFNDYDQVDLVISRPVSRELDNKKNSNRRRLRNRARRILKTIVDSQERGDDYICIHQSNPEVRLYVELRHDPSCDSKYHFDQTNDEQILSTAVAYKDRFGGSVGILSDDNTPRIRAKDFDLKATRIPDDWRLSQEITVEQREVDALKRENDSLRQSSPIVSIDLDVDDNDSNHFEIHNSYYPPLTENEVLALMEVLCSTFPVETEYESEPEDKKPKIGGIDRSLGLRISNERYIPLTDETISHYCDNEYPAWLGECQELLTRYHHHCAANNNGLTVAFNLENSGGQPVEDCIIVFETQGDIEIYVSSKSTDEEAIKKSDCQFKLPPSPPRGKWIFEKRDLLSDHFSSIRNMHNLYANTPTIRDISKFSPDSAELCDVNEFYYRPSRPELPVQSFKLACKQWRHQEGCQNFSMSLWFDQKPEIVHGNITCTVTALNIPTPVKKTARVVIKNEHLSTYKKAKEAMKTLAASAQPCVPQNAHRPQV